MSKSEKTSRGVAHKAAKVLSNPTSSKTAKTLAGSALAQSGTKKQTSSRVASTAARILDNSKSSKTSKSLAGSVLTQRGSNFPVKSFPIHGSTLTKSERVAAVRKVSSTPRSTTSSKKK